MKYSIGILNGQVYIDGKFEKINIYIDKEKIQEISTQKLDAKEYFDATGLKVVPGLIDAHVHLAMNTANGKTADDYKTGSINAIHGGITTMIDFLDVKDSVSGIYEAFDQKMQEAKKSYIDYGFHTSVAGIKDSPTKIAQASIEIGAPTIKMYSTYKPQGIYSSDLDIEKMLIESSKQNIRILVHCEKDSLIDKKTNDIVAHSKNRPVLAETAEVVALAKIAAEHDGNLYIVHTSAGTTIERLRKDFKEHLNKQIILESVPHYFLLDDSYYQREDNYLFTMTPPLRDKDEVKKLISYIDDISVISTDHCPFLKKQKEKESLKDIPMGVGGMERSFGLMYDLFGDKIIDKFTSKPAKIHGLYPQKGQIASKADADLTFFKVLDKSFVPPHSGDYSIYEHIPTFTKISAVMNRGEWVLKDGTILEHQGKYIKRKLG